MTLTARAIGALTVPALGVPLLATPAHAATLPAPPATRLPSALDVAPPYQGQRICDPNAKPGVVSFAQLMVTHYGVGSSGGIVRACGSGITEHSEGRAWDWMLNASKPEQKAVADAVVRWLSAPDAQGRPGAMARRFGVMYIIWNRQMWRVYAPERGWAPYTGSSPHTDHIHFSFSWDGAYRRTSWWTGRALTTVDPGPAPRPLPAPTTPPSTPESVYRILLPGAVGPEVALAQRALGVPADGIFGPVTLAALQRWQAAQGVPVSGVLDAATWSRMVALGLVPARSGTAPAKPAPAKPAPPAAPVTVRPQPSPLAPYAASTLRRGATGPAVVALQRALAVTADGDFGPRTEAAVRAFQSRRNLPATGVVGPATWQALMDGPAATTPGPSRGAPAPRPGVTTPSTTTAYTPLMAVVLRPGSSGPAVRTLQAALGGLAVDGSYGARTTAAVRAFQQSRRLKVTGVTDTAVWKALEARDHPLLAYRTTVLRRGSSGPAVVALQRALRLPADGAFGPQTEAAVKALQGRAKLARTGVVAALTWQALEAELRRR